MLSALDYTQLCALYKIEAMTLHSNILNKQMAQFIQMNLLTVKLFKFTKNTKINTSQKKKSKHTL